MLTDMNESRNRLHLEAFERKMKELQVALKREDTEALLLQQAVYYGVKAFAGNRRIEPNTADEALFCWRAAHTILQLIGALTPEQLEEVFPINKTYNGERREVKDYFFTKEILKKLPQDKMISESLEPFELLMDYENTWLRVFLVRYMHYGDCIRRAQGKKSVMEEWADMNDIATYTMHTDQAGKKFLMESGSGKVTPVTEKKPRRPKWIHAVKPTKQVH